MGYSSTLLCLSTFTISLSLLALSSFTTADDAAVMKELLAALNGVPGGWSNSTDPCTWENVHCDGNSRVSDINLSFQSWSGTLPSNLGSLTHLTYLYLEGNSFSGPLPSLANLSSLQTLLLDKNKFTSIPDGFFQGLTSLQTLSLSQNTNLAPWTIPTELTQATSLVTFNASSANVVGPLPDSLATLPDLQFLDVSNNNLTGPIPKFTSTLKFNATGNPLLGKTPGPSVSPGMIAAGIVTLFAVIGIVVFVTFCFRRKLLSNKIFFFWKKKSPTHQTVQTFLRNYKHLAIRRYSYSDIKKITNFFRDKLGEGGYGVVYKGQLQDGCLVAVKVLKESRGDGEEFINEVVSISKTSHINIVSLIGFCFEGSKRALMYEFMPNGSLEKFIYKENSSRVDRQLEWMTLYKIALGIARGLEYLHRGCNTRTVHFDIKPHNILLDENFCPKISDFGLAKICPREKSIISMLGARGTVGYIAPEVYCRNFGRVSHKSDVYSYGMMVFEMVRGGRNKDVEIDHTSETFFPHWIYKRLEQDEDLELHGLINENDHEYARKMIIVSLWCIQTNPSNRPPISRVVNMLEGSLESLQVPSKPILSSPSRPPQDSSTIMESLQYDSAIPLSASFL